MFFYKILGIHSSHYIPFKLHAHVTLRFYFICEPLVRVPCWLEWGYLQFKCPEHISLVDMYYNVRTSFIDAKVFQVVVPTCKPTFFMGWVVTAFHLTWGKSKKRARSCSISFPVRRIIIFDSFHSGADIVSNKTCLLLALSSGLNFFFFM